MRTLLNALFICLLASFAGIALAQTPDGQTPSQEDVCDGESGAAFGLCNAYCEAMDCHCPNTQEGDPGHPDCVPNANENACMRVFNRFYQITGRDLPCEVQLFTLTVEVIGNGTVNGGPGLIDPCRGDRGVCSDVLADGSGVLLLDDADAGWTFSGWGGDCDASGNVTMDADKTCTAPFVEDVPPPPTATCPCASGTEQRWSDWPTFAFSLAGQLWSGAGGLTNASCAGNGTDTITITGTLIEGGPVNVVGVTPTQCTAMNDAPFPSTVSGTLDLTPAEAAQCFLDLQAASPMSCP